MTPISAFIRDLRGEACLISLKLYFTPGGMARSRRAGRKIDNKKPMADGKPWASELICSLFHNQWQLVRPRLSGKPGAIAGNPYTREVDAI